MDLFSRWYLRMDPQERSMGRARSGMGQWIWGVALS